VRRTNGGDELVSTDVAARNAGCAYCLWRFVDTPQDPTVECEYCQTPYHVECFEENAGCVTFGCPAWTAAQLGEPLPPLTMADEPDQDEHPPPFWSGSEYYVFEVETGPVLAHRHMNGGGWVANTAMVADSAFVGRLACVFDRARVIENASVDGTAWVLGDATVEGDARIRGDAEINGLAHVMGQALVTGQSFVTDSTVVKDSAVISGSARIVGHATVGGHERFAGDPGEGP
jgi:hypothetical protein